MARVLGTATLAMSLTACNPYGFDGWIDSITPATVSFKYGPAVQVEGWVHSTQPGPWWVFATIDGVVAELNPGGSPSHTATAPRPDVEGVRGGHAGGFRMSIEPPGYGWHRLCVHAVPSLTEVPQSGLMHSELDSVACRLFLQPVDWGNRGYVDRISVQGGVVTVEGWTRFHQPGIPSFLTIGVLADGGQRTPLSHQDLPRPDVDAVYGEGSTGFINTYAATPPVSQWCVATFSVGGSGETDLLDCKDQPAG